MLDRTASKILVTLIMISAFSTATMSNAFTVLAQPATLEEILAAIEALDERLDDLETNATALNSAFSSLVTVVDIIQSRLDSISATAATTLEVAILNSALDALTDVVNNLESDLASLNTTAASKSDLATLSASLDELSTALDDVKANLSSLSNVAATSSDIDAATTSLSENIETLNKLVIVAIVIALIAAVTSTVALYYILKKQTDKTARI